MYKYLYIFIYINLYFALSCPKIPHLKRLMTSRSNFRNYCKSKSKDKVSLTTLLLARVPVLIPKIVFLAF